MRSVLLFMMCVGLLSSCDDSRVYEKNYDFKDRNWVVNDVPVFEFDVTDSAARYNLYCNLRNTVSFPFSRFFVRYSLKDSTGRELESKLTSAYLFDQKTGKPHGSSALGDIYDHRIPILNNYQFKNAGKFSVSFQQFMRTDTLEGILAVGVRVEKLQPAQK